MLMQSAPLCVFFVHTHVHTHTHPGKGVRAEASPGGEVWAPLQFPDTHASPCPPAGSTTDVHTVASLLKLYLRELPEPVVPFARYEDFLSCAQLLTKDEGEVSGS